MMLPLNQLFNMDCMEGMKDFPDNYFDLAIVDPPYGLGDKLTRGGTWNVRWQDKGSDWDKKPSKEYWVELFRVSKNWIVFGGNYFIDHLPACRNFIAWHKPYMDGMHSMSNVELALTSFDMNAKKVSFNKDKGGQERIHVCQKPIKLYEWIIQNYSTCSICNSKGHFDDTKWIHCEDCLSFTPTILDTHVGSGSSIIAFEHYGCDWIGFEIDKDYYEAAQKRIKQELSQTRLF